MANILKTDNMRCWWSVEQLTLSSSAHENKNWYNHFAKLIGSMCKLEYQHSLWPSNSISRYIPNRNSMPKDMYKNVHSRFIHNGPKLKTTQCISIGEWIHKLWYIHTIEFWSAMKKNKLLLLTLQINLRQ